MFSTFANKLKATAEQDLYLVTGFDFTGRACWYLVKVRAAKAAQFEAMIARQEMTSLAEFGEVTRSGYGNYPPADA